MAGFTKIKSRPSVFVQPALGGTVNILMDSAIDWIAVGQTVHIPNGGLYKVISISGFVHTLKLETAVALQGETVSANVIYPVNDNSGETKWGGENGKEW